MAEHAKSKSTGGIYRSEWSPCKSHATSLTWTSYYKHRPPELYDQQPGEEQQALTFNVLQKRPTTEGNEGTEGTGDQGCVNEACASRA